MSFQKFNKVIAAVGLTVAMGATGLALAAPANAAPVKAKLAIKVTPIRPIVNASKHTVAIPYKPGVTYYINGVKAAPKMYTKTSAFTVTARPSSNIYVLSGTTSWKFDNRTVIFPLKPSFSAKNKTIYTSKLAHANFYLNGKALKPGTVKNGSYGTVTIKPINGSYKINGATSWKFDNRTAVSAPRPVISAAKNTIKIPNKAGVSYYLNGKKVSNNKTYAFKNGTRVLIIARASTTGYRMTGVPVWSTVL